MAIADVKEYTHLTAEEVEQLGAELDALRAEIEESRNSLAGQDRATRHDQRG